jgi:hypothetical protein
MADEWIKGNSLDGLTDKEKEEYKKSLVAYMLSNMPPDSIVNKVERQTNENSENWRKQMDIQLARERMAFEASENEKDRDDSATKLDIQEMLDKGEKTRTVTTPNSQMGTFSSDDMVYTVYDSKLGKVRQVAGWLIKQDQKAGRVYYDHKTGKNLFKVPEGNVQYEQGAITYYNDNGNVKAISKGTAYTTKYDPISGKTEYVPVLSDVQLPIKDMTKSSGVIDNARSAEEDIRRGKPVKSAAEGTGGTGSYSTGSSRYSSGN